jgi:hypothetical protein
MDFQSFIVKYSFVNSSFVKDFYNIIKFDYTFFTEKWDSYLTIFIYKIISLYE